MVLRRGVSPKTDPKAAFFLASPSKGTLCWLKWQGVCIVQKHLRFLGATQGKGREGERM